MHINKEGRNLIKSFESLVLKAYKDTGGVPTIGWGHTNTVEMGQSISVQKAEELLDADIAEAEQIVNRHVRVPLTENQYSALVSFAFNIGDGQFMSSSLLRFLNAGKYTDAANQFLRWTYDNGKKLNGLARRREAERALFLKE